MIVVDAAPLIYLSRIGRLELLKKLYGKLALPQGVWGEVVAEAQGRPGAAEVERAVKGGWMKTERVLTTRSLSTEGAEGADGEVIALAEKMKLPILTNDRALAVIARTHGVRVKWLTQAIVDMVRAEIITTLEARMLLRDLVRAGLRVRSEVLTEVIHQIEE